jgi:hypothetical protein
VDVYRFVAHPGIRQEKETIATQPIEPKCIEYLRRSEATRKSEIPDRVSARAGLHARLGAATLKWRKPTGRPASKMGFS